MWVEFFVLSVYILGFFVVLGILIYLIIRRFKIKEEETFEKRDN